MFGKLLKQEFRATSRFMWMIYAAMLFLSLGSHFSMIYLDAEESSAVLNILAVLVTVLWVLSLIFGIAMTVILMVNRFHKNLLTDEGYLMFTLPTGVHSLILSKLIVAVVWAVVTILVMVLGVALAVIDSSFLQQVGESFGIVFQYMDAELGLNIAAMAAELMLMGILALACSMLQFYAAMAIGYGFNGHKLLLSVLFYFGIGIGFQIIGSLVMTLGGDGILMLTTEIETMTGWHMTMLGALGSQLLSGGVLYFLTAWNLKKRLNLA